MDDCLHNPHLEGGPSRRLLIVNADDLGRSRGVSEGILRAHRRGVVSSTTAMVNLPHAEAAVRRALVEAPGLGIGVHLNLTAGRPVLPAREVPTLVDASGRLYPIRQFVPRLAALDTAQVRAELGAQVERLRAWGCEPTHLDAHHHSLYLAPRLFRVLVELAEGQDLPIRYPWPRGMEGWGAAGPFRVDVEALAEAHRVAPEDLPEIIAGCDAILRASGLRAPERCILTFFGPTATLPHLLEVVAALPAGISELMCHPGVADDELRAGSGYALQREQELAVLTDRRVREALREAGVALASFAALGD
jgi:predicted glycoside hydrolase/deacetylase ChbG (UPF0249 family)